jgi:DnaD/phage-associated family protein
MASRRMIASDIWRDDFIGSLSLFGRILWVGLIVTCADDQGRILNNAKLIRSDVFPLDDIPLSDIEDQITAFVQAGKIIIYEIDGKSLIQIVHWWEYQTPSWASPSKYKAPSRWTDRHKYHTAGNKIVTLNWDKQGGIERLPSPLPSPLPTGIEDVNGEVKDKDEDEAEGKVDRNDIDHNFGALCTVYEKNIGTLTPIVSDSLQSDLSQYGLQNCMDAITEALRNNVRKWSYVQGILKRWSTDGKAQKPGLPPPPKMRKLTDAYGNTIEVPL